MFCNVGYAEDVNFVLELSCTTIEEKFIVKKKHGQWTKASNQKPEIYSLEKIIKNNKIKTYKRNLIFIKEDYKNPLRKIKR